MSGSKVGGGDAVSPAFFSCPYLRKELRRNTVASSSLGAWYPTTANCPVYLGSWNCLCKRTCIAVLILLSRLELLEILFGTSNWNARWWKRWFCWHRSLWGYLAFLRSSLVAAAMWFSEVPGSFSELDGSHRPPGCQQHRRPLAQAKAPRWERAWTTRDKAMLWCSTSRGYARHQRGGSGSMTISPARAMPGRYLSIGIKEVYIWQLYAHFVVMNFVLCWTLQFHTVLVVNKIYVVSNIAVVWTNMTTEYAWNSLKNLKLEPSYLVSLWLGCVSYIYCIVLCYTNESLVSGTAPP